MYSADYDLITYCGEYIAEGSNTNKWLTKAKDRSLVVSLEDEIQVLRKKMESTFLQEKSFTSDIVIEISSLLDLKINEYMKHSGKRRI